MEQNDPNRNQEHQHAPAPLSLPDQSQPRPLEYEPYRRKKYQAKTSFGTQAFAGFLAWIGGVVFVMFAGNNRIWQSIFLNSQQATSCAIGFALISAGGLMVWLRIRYRWRGFLPGLLIGFGLTCLVPIGILWVICGTGRHL